MKEGRDLAITIITSAVLLLGAGYLTQCSAPQHRLPDEHGAEAGGDRGGAAENEAEHEEKAGKPKSARELDEEEGQEEREKIQRVGRALQTIGANPELRKTYGIPQ